MPLGKALEKGTQLGNGWIYKRRNPPGSHGIKTRWYTHVISRQESGAGRESLSVAVQYHLIHGQPWHFNVKTELPPRGINQSHLTTVIHSLSTLLGLELVSGNIYRKPREARELSRVEKPTASPEDVRELNPAEHVRSTTPPPRNMRWPDFVRLVTELGYEQTKKGFKHPSGHTFIVRSGGEIRDPRLLAKIWKLKENKRK